jgi:hypothetical protein
MYYDINSGILSDGLSCANGGADPGHAPHVAQDEPREADSPCQRGASSQLLLNIL